MYPGSGRYLFGILRSRFLFLYGVGGGVNTAIQLLAIHLHLIGRGESVIDALPYVLSKFALVAVPILPPYGPVDILSVLFNVLIAVLVAFSWTAAWSEGMHGYHGR